MYYVLEYEGTHEGMAYGASTGSGSRQDMFYFLDSLLSQGIYKIDVRAYEDEFTTKEER